MLDAKHLFEQLWEKQRTIADLAREFDYSQGHMSVLIDRAGVMTRRRFLMKMHELPDSVFEEHMVRLLAINKMGGRNGGTPYWSVSSTNSQGLERLAYTLEWDCNVAVSILNQNKEGHHKKLEVFGYERLQALVEKYGLPWMSELDKRLQHQGLTWDTLPTPHSKRQLELAQVMDEFWTPFATIKDRMGWDTPNTHATLKTAISNCNVQARSVGPKQNEYRWVSRKPWYVKTAYGIYRGNKITVAELVEEYAIQRDTEVLGPENPLHVFIPQYVFQADGCTYSIFDLSAAPPNEALFDYDMVIVIAGPDIQTVGEKMSNFGERLKGEKGQVQKILRPPYDDAREMKDLYMSNPAAVERILFSHGIAEKVRAMYRTTWEISDGALEELAKAAKNQALVIHYLLSKVNPLPRSVVRKKHILGLNPQALIAQGFDDWCHQDTDVTSVYRR